jgi:hypothetical protein
MAWAKDYSDQGLKLIGLAEVLGAIGLVVLWLLGIACVLTPLAALGSDRADDRCRRHAPQKERRPLRAGAGARPLSAIVAWGRF